jgi:hypothetical protein
MVRKFLYFIAIIIVLIIVGAIALSYWSREATELAFVPRGEFVEQNALQANAYEDPAMWISRPGIGTDDPARWQPAIRPPEGELAEAPPARPVETRDYAVFFVHPTSYIPGAFESGALWNAPLDNADADARAKIFVRGMASPFNSASEIWAPRYRQAVFGAFLTDKPEAARAIDAAYRDVAQAFDYFIESVDPETPIVLAGHSQGALHLTRLLDERIAGTPLQSRIAAVYAVGWPISIEHDLPEMGLPACATAGQSGCVISWSSFAEPADPGDVIDRYRNSAGLDGEMRGDSRILCVNPITGTLDADAPASANLGTLVPDADLTTGELVPAAVPARCDDRGLLLIGDPPEMGNYVLPGNNYHVYDIPLFWANLQADVAARVMAWKPAP